MSTALKHYLQQTQLSAGMEAFTDGENDLDVHIAPEPSVDQVVQDVVEAEFEQRDIARDNEVLNQATTAMENYATFLDHAIENGGVTQQTAVALSMGMEQYVGLFGEEEGEDSLIPSIEEIGGSSSMKEGAKQWASRVWEWLKKAYDVSKRIFQQMLNSLKTLWNKATFAADRLQRRAGQLKSRADALKGETLSSDKKKLELSGASKYFIGSEFVGTNAMKTTKMVGTLTITIPMGLGKWIDNVASATHGFKPGDTINAGQLALPSELIRVFNNAATTDQRFGKGLKVLRSDALPGNKAMYLAYPDKAVVSGNTSSEGDGESLGGYRMDVLSIPGAKNEDKHTLAVATPAELAEMAKSLGKAAADLKSGINKGANFTNALESLDKSIEKLVSQLKGKELKKEDKEQLQSVLALAKSARSVGSGVGGGYSLCVTLISAQLGLVERQLAQYGKKASDSQGASNAAATA